MYPRAIPADIARLLEEEASRINSTAFIAADPVQFPRRYSRLRDIEITSLLAAIIAWGNRTMICRDIERLLGWMEHEPALYLQEQGYEDFPDEQNIHRTFFGRHFKYFMRGLNAIYSRYDSLDSFCSASGVPQSETPSWELVGAMQRIMSDANGGAVCPQCLPVNLDKTALKRINMALRWLVRDDGIVDMGVWKSIPRSKLYIPLDVHVGNTARSLGLVDRKANDRKTVTDLTAALRTLRPEDPVFFDYALFGIGIEAKKATVGDSRK